MFIFICSENNKKIYAFHRNHGNRYELRFKDRKCLGTAQYESGEIKITKNWKITKFNDHDNYIKEKSVIERIKAN